MDYYRTLGVPPSASARAIREAYLNLVRRFHPDRVGYAGTPRFQNITEAYETLSDPVKRRLYDRSLELASVTAAPEPVEETTPQRPRPEPLVPEPISVLGERETVRPSFDGLYEPFLSDSTGLGAPKSEHVEAFEIGVILTRSEAARGVALRLAVPVLQECLECGALGGTIFPCPECAQLGLLEQEAPVIVHIPPNVPDGTIIEAPLTQLGIRNFYLRVHVAIQREVPVPIW